MRWMDGWMDGLCCAVLWNTFVAYVLERPLYLSMSALALARECTESITVYGQCRSQLCLLCMLESCVTC